MTRKLYYEDCHLREFIARVVSCEAAPKGWEVVLDQTAFYPEGGGQACDIGSLDGVKVLDTRERGEEVIHLCDGPLEAGREVTGKIDWQRVMGQLKECNYQGPLTLELRYGKFYEHVPEKEFLQKSLDAVKRLRDMMK